MAQVAIHAGLFSDPPQARLLAGACDRCAEKHFPAADFCPYCGDGSVRRVEVGAVATLHLHTVVHAPPPGYPGPVPYGFGLVDLPEGLRVVTRLVAEDLDGLRCGMPMRLVVSPLYEDDDGNEVLSWAYTPSAEANT